jgi:Helicase associated domain
MWNSTQRQYKDTMSADRRRRLDDIGFIWNTHEARWEEGFAALTKFKAREGHCNVHYLHVEGTYKLGQWVCHQRRDTLSNEQRRRLDDIGFIWDVFEAKWEEGFAELVKFKSCEGRCKVHALHIEGTFKLGHWVNHQRQAKDTMSAKRRRRLDDIGFVWSSSGKNKKKTAA